jgi:hypothetical protein
MFNGYLIDDVQIASRRPKLFRKSYAESANSTRDLYLGLPSRALLGGGIDIWYQQDQRKAETDQE